MFERSNIKDRLIPLISGLFCLMLIFSSCTKEELIAPVQQREFIERNDVRSMDKQDSPTGQYELRGANSEEDDDSGFISDDGDDEPDREKSRRPGSNN